MASADHKDQSAQAMGTAEDEEKVNNRNPMLPKEFEDDDLSTITKRNRKLTRKRLLYQLEIKEKIVRKMCQKLSRLQTEIMSIIKDEKEYECVRHGYKNWLMAYEEFIDCQIQYMDLARQGEATEFMNTLDTLSNTFLQFKTETQRWISSQEDTRKKLNNTPVREFGDNSSRASRHSSRSSLSSARIKEEQKKAEIMARSVALERKQELEMKRLRLKMEEERLELDTELAISAAKVKIIDEYEENDPFPKVRDDVTNPMIVRLSKPAQTLHPDASHGNSVDDLILTVVKQMRKPLPQIKNFGGEPLEFRKFIRQFKSKILANSDSADENMNYLEQFTCGEANKIVKGFGYLDAEVGFVAAIKELEERYGNEHTVVNAFVQRALDWPVIKADNPKGLDDFSIFLCECDNAVQCVSAVSVLDYTENIKRLLGKLPYHYQEKFRGVALTVKETGQVVKFKHLVDFVKKESKKANDPIFGKEALRKDVKEDKYRKRPQPTKSKYAFATKTDKTDHTYEVRRSNHTDKGGMTQDGRNDIRNKTCPFCNSFSHTLEYCERIASTPYAERLQFLKANRLCFKCLTSGHMSRECSANVVCRICKNRHQTFLHMKPSVFRNMEQTKPHVKINEDKSIASACSDYTHELECDCDMGARETDCAMAIIPIIVRKRNSAQAVQTYAFLDPGSSVSFCTDKLMRQIGASGRKMNITLETMGTPHSMKTYAVDGLEVSDLEQQNVITMPRVYTKDKMPVTKDHIPTEKDLSRWPHLNSIPLQHLETDIGVLIGNNVPDAYTPLDVRTGPSGSPHAVKTRLGWVMWNVIRHTDGNFNQEMTCYVNRAEVTAIEELENSQKLEKIVRQSINFDFPESLSDEKKQPSLEDKQFTEKVKRSIQLFDGHYYINLPFRSNDVHFPDNRRMVLQRLESLRRKLQKNDKLYDDYKVFMQSLLDKKYAEKIPDNELECAEGKEWYIPHHAVYHPHKQDKIRVVFDCAAVCNGVSLNTELLSGPNLLNSLLGILLRFRQEEVAIMGDIETMYYQVRVPPEDCDFMRFYWWPDGDIGKNPEVYRMLVHMFGAISSPTCSNIALRQSAIDNEDDFNPSVTKTVLNDFYVDDCLSSVPTAEEAVSRIDGVSNMCRRGGFRVTKWTSNRHDVLSQVPQDERAKEVKKLDLTTDQLPSERALGIYWSVEDDKIGFNIQARDKPMTRRGLLSVTSSVYDPLGLASPFILKAKILQQELCQLKLSWDDPLSEKHQQTWENWLRELPYLENIDIPRCYKPSGFGEVVNCQIHMFSDASEVGYGVVAYVRVRNKLNQVHCSLVMSKSRVAPLKKMSIPRMELTAASISVKLYKFIAAELEYEINDVVFWTDSTAVLKYINNEKTRFQTFVANRVAVIRDGTEASQWRYIESKLNPADAASRGMNIEQFLSASYWFNGPKFLYEPEQEWCQLDKGLLSLDEADFEVKRIVNVSRMSGETDTVSRLLNYFSSWTKLKSAVAWILLVKANLRQRIKEKFTSEANQDNKTQRKDKVPRLSVENLKEAEDALINYVQKEHYSEELQVLKSKSQRIKKSSTVYRLDPILVDGVIRVGGRLQRAEISFDSKHPVLLPKNCPVSKLILMDIHESVGHLGKNSMLCALRQKYWIPGAGTLINQLVSKCVVCRKYKAHQMSQKMADLPSDRLVPNEPPFSRTGVDYFGPFFVKRGRAEVKRYGVIFTCMTSRAVHLEVASSLTTDSCINCLRRFIARRGTPKVIWSDNGTNLIGAEKELRQEIERWNQAHIHKELSQRNVMWNFNPPYGSHHGGVWERLIRSVRKVLNGLLNQLNHSLDDESLLTLLCEVEAILNSRPITSNPSNPSDLSPLTPNHLLRLHGCDNRAPGFFSAGDDYAKRRWRHVQFLANLFWQRWVKEYLPMLQFRQKWTQKERNVAVDDVVLLIDSAPRSSWKMGRITEVYPDKKGLIRSVKVRTSLSELSHSE